MNARPLPVLRARDLAAAETAARKALREWESAWGTLPGGDAAATAAGGPAPLPGSSFAPWRLPGGGWLWAAMAPAARRWFQQALAGGSGEDAEGLRDSALGAALAEEALPALVRGVGRALCAAEPEPDAAGPAGLPARGALLLRLGGAVHALHLLVPQACLACLPRGASRPSGRPVAPLADALAPARVRLSVQVGTAELTIGHLATLAEGDVITLATRLDQPLTLLAPGGAAAGQAYLGMRAGARAVRLVNPSTKRKA
jgi:hypothetical protein